MGAWNPQESVSKAPLSCNAAISMLQCSFSFAAAQLFVQMTSALQKSECCSAVSAVQHSKNCSATSVFACGMLQGWGLEGWGLGLADESLHEENLPPRGPPKNLREVPFSNLIFITSAPSEVFGGPLGDPLVGNWCWNNLGQSYSKLLNHGCLGTPSCQRHWDRHKEIDKNSRYKASLRSAHLPATRHSPTRCFWCNICYVWSR